MTDFSRPIDESAPNGDLVYASELDTIIQQLKVDIRERIQVEHEFPTGVTGEARHKTINVVGGNVKGDATEAPTSGIAVGNNGLWIPSDTRYISIGAASFHARNGVTNYKIKSSPVYVYASNVDSPASLSCPIHFLNGSILTRLTLFGCRTHTYDECYITLKVVDGYGVVQLEHYLTVNTGGDNTVFKTLDILVDNSVYYYCLEATVATSSGESGDGRLYGVRIDYTIEKL